MSVAFLFPGQGSQHVGMGRDLYQVEPASRAVFDQADDLLGFPLSRLCFEGPEDRLTDTVNQQPALLVTSVAAWRALAAPEQPAAQYVAGHSLGEFTALVAAGSLSFADGLALVRRRGELMKAAGEREPGAMAAILALDVAVVEQICLSAQEQVGRPVQVANDNCPGQIVISGDRSALEKAVEMAKDAAKTIVADITGKPVTEPEPLGVLCLVDMGDSAVFARAKPLLPPRQEAVWKKGIVYKWGKYAFEKYLCALLNLFSFSKLIRKFFIA